MTGGTAAPGRFRAGVVVPCFNEARRLNVPRFREFLAKAVTTRLLFVDDGSRDGTLRVLDDVCRDYQDRTIVVKQNRNRGKAEAVRTGINRLLNDFDQEFIGYWDADLATPLESVAGFITVFDRRPDIAMVFGARVKLLGRRIERNPARHYLGRVFATAVSVMLQLPIYDSQCGAKLFRVKNETRQVFAEPFVSNWVFDVEILARYLNVYNQDRKRLEEAIYEYALEVWTDMEGSKVGPGDFLKAFFDILKIKRKYL